GFGIFFYFCAAMFNFTIILNYVVYEKENKLREGMRMMGLKVMSIHCMRILTHTHIGFCFLGIVVYSKHGNCFHFYSHGYCGWNCIWVLFLFTCFYITNFFFFLSYLLRIFQKLQLLCEFFGILFIWNFCNTCCIFVQHFHQQNKNSKYIS